MHIGIIGTGYVGLVTGACFAEFGLFVTCVDRDKKKIRSLKKGIIPFYEPGLQELVKRNVAQGRLEFSTAIKRAVVSSLVLFIAVGTPRRGDGSADLRYVEQVASEIADNINALHFVDKVREHNNRLLIDIKDIENNKYDLINYISGQKINYKGIEIYQENLEDKFMDMVIENE